MAGFPVSQFLSVGGRIWWGLEGRYLVPIGLHLDSAHDALFRIRVFLSWPILGAHGMILVRVVVPCIS